MLCKLVIEHSFVVGMFDAYCEACHQPGQESSGEWGNRSDISAAFWDEVQDWFEDHQEEVVYD